MIEIRTNSGVSLDLAPDAEFEVEMNNPILESERIPVAFSTAITFPPSDTNRSVFGYLPAMLLPPTLLKVGCTILSEGIPILVGNLIYDGLDEGGNLVYTFTEKSIDEALDTKLYELNLPDSRTSEMTADQLAASIRDGQQEGIGAPVLYDPEGSVTQFHNLPLELDTRFTPCVSLQRLFAEANIQIDSAVAGIWNNLYILGLYKPFTGNIKGYDYYLSVAEALPDITLLDLLKEFCKMTCSAVFVSSGKYIVVPFQSTLSRNPLNWNGKISDKHSFTIEKATGYGFGYPMDEKVKGTISGDVTPVITLKGVLDARVEGEYTPVRCTQTGDTYSVPPEDIYLEALYYARTCEILHISDMDYDNEIEGEKQDNHLSASLVMNVPVCFMDMGTRTRSAPEGGGEEPEEEHYRMAGYVTFPKDGCERDTNAILGSYGSDQFVGKGVGMTDSGEDLQIASSLDAGALHTSFHRNFETWLAKDRQVIALDLDLSMQDISSFRMWNPVTVRNRLFLVKRLTLRLSARTSRVLSSVELISL